MKRWIGSIVLMGVAGAAFAQGPFTIARPADGSRVREKVRVLIPKGSIPPGGYVGVFLNDKFLEAVVPPLQGKYYVYTLDTKGRGLTDTAAGQSDKLEFILYAEADDKARVVDRTSVNIRISNYSNIPVPNRGLNLRYKFVPGNELVYNLSQRVSINSATEDQLNRGAKAGTVGESEGEKLRLSYTVVNSYPGGDGLLRLQPLPRKGKDYADYTVDPSAGAQRYYSSEMDSIYMRVTSTGREVFGALPPYVPMTGTSGPVQNNSLYAAFPLPSLPEKSVRPGDSWPSRFQRGAINLTEKYDSNSIVANYPARGEFVRVEWERSHPCAVIRNVIEAGTKTADAKKLAGANAEAADDKIGVSETIWFAMDTRQILKIVRDVTIDRKADVTTPGMGGGYGGGMPGMGMPGAPAGMGRPGGGGGGKAGDLALITQRGGMGLGRPGQGGRPGFQGAAPGAGMMGPGMGMPGMGMGQGGASTTVSTVTRIRVVQTFTLEE